eukprot:12916316-Prorocentrum_lima.AAC.1
MEEVVLSAKLFKLTIESMSLLPEKLDRVPWPNESQLSSLQRHAACGVWLSGLSARAILQST